MDDTATIDYAKSVVKKFCDDRDWEQYHNPKDIAIGMVTEASELLQIFRFKTPEQAREIVADPARRGDVCDELSDVFYCVLRFAQLNGIDLITALEGKIRKNEEKYQADLVRGRNKKYDEYRI